MKLTLAKKAAAGKGGVLSVLHTGHAQPALPDHERWPDTYA